jgi:hypothetical protein
MRLPDWNERLTALLAEARTKPFKWGVHDCATLAAQAIDAQCGTKVAAELKEVLDASTTEQASKTIIPDAEALAALVSKWLDPTPIPPMLCERGYICLYADDEGKPHGLAIHDGQAIVGPSGTGLRRVALHHLMYGWKVG